MTHYRPNWERAAILAVGSSISLFVGLYPALLTQTNSIHAFHWVYLIVTSFVWVVVVSLVAAHSFRSLRIEDRDVVFTRFTRVVDRRPIDDLIEVREERHIWPGRLSFSDGTVKLVSGIALGRSDDFYEAMQHLNPKIAIVRYESAT